MNNQLHRVLLVVCAGLVSACTVFFDPNPSGTLTDSAAPSDAADTSDATDTTAVDDATDADPDDADVDIEDASETGPDADVTDAAPDSDTTDAEPDSPDATNECGGVTALDGAVGDPCGECGSGALACDGMEALACVGDLGVAARNQCSGCEPLAGSVGDPCGTCGSGRRVCDGEDALTCDADLGAAALNDCGGCGALGGEPGTECGTCDTGLFACSDDRSHVICEGDLGDEVLNECGGCGEAPLNECGACAVLDGGVGDRCGTCNTGNLECTDDGLSLACVWAPGALRENECGGCRPLSGEIGEVCGLCDSGLWACGDSPDSVRCDGGTDPSVLNACGGCATLTAAPFDECDDCDGAACHFACDGFEAIECSRQLFGFIPFQLGTSVAAPGDLMGVSVGISGGRIVAGAPGAGWGGTATVFERAELAPSWRETATLSPSDVRWDDEFGTSVAVSGNRIVVGADLHDEAGVLNVGAAYVFEMGDDLEWSEVANLTLSSPLPEQRFGISVDIDGDTLVVGAFGVAPAGAAYVYERNTTGGWDLSSTLTGRGSDVGDRFGWSVSISGDIIVVGGPYNPDDAANGGSAFAFERQSEGAWTEMGRLSPAGLLGDAHFGTAVAVHGSVAAVGAPGQMGTGRVYLFEWDEASGSWSPSGSLIGTDITSADTPYFGGAVSLHERRLLVGAYEDDATDADSGAAYLFEQRSDGTWVEVTKYVSTFPRGSDRFGWSVGVSEQGVAIGTPHDSHGSIADSGVIDVFDTP